MNTPNPAHIPPLPVGAAAPTTRLVLLAHSDRTRRRLLAAQLERAGYRVIEAGDASAAVTLDREQQPDLILCDRALDGLSGSGFCPAYSTRRRPGHGYFILLTTRANVADIPDAFQAGVDDVLVMPLDPAELLFRLAAAGRRIDTEHSLEAANRDLQRALTMLSATHDRMNDDLHEARKLQQALVRERQRRFGAMRVSVLMRPAGLIGGDLVGFRQLDDATVGLHALDVSGHGVAAAMLATRLAAQIEGLSARRSSSPARVAATLNRLMFEGPQTDSYLTMVYAHLDLPTGRVRLVQAGHPHPIVQRSDGTVESVGDGGLPVGVVASARFDQVDVTLAPGDRMLIVSDGITDVASRGGAILGEDGLRAILQLNAPLSGFGLLESMCWSVSEFAAGESLDDASALLVEHLAPARVLAGPDSAGDPKGGGR